MSDQAQAAAVVQPTTLSAAQAAAQWTAAKAAGRTVDGDPNNRNTNPNVNANNQISDAARMLGQRAAQARQERTTQAGVASQEIVQQVVDEPALGGEPQDGTETGESPEVKAADNQDNPDTGTIDLGEGVALTKAEIRENLMLKADHTRRLQALAEDRKGLEAERSQKLSQLDGIIGELQQKIGQPKTLKQWLSDDPIGGLERFADQQEQMAEVNRAAAARNEANQRAYSASLDLRDKQLAESYNTAWADPAKRDADYTAMTAFALKMGADANEVRSMTKPWMIQILHKAMQRDAAEAGAANVTKMVNGKPQVVRPGARVSTQASQANSLNQATARLQKTGSIADAAAILGLRRAQRG